VISRQIQDLESILGVQLFERLPRGVQLSQYGKLFLEDARRVLNDVGDIAGRFIDGSIGETSPLKIGLNDGASWNGAVPIAIRHFREKYPSLRLELLPMSSSAALEAVIAGELHMAFVQSMPERYASLCYQQVEENRVMLAMHQDNPLASRKSIRLSDLRGEPFVLLSRLPNSFYHDELISRCEKGGLSLCVLQEVHKETSLLSLVSTGMAVGWVLAAADQRRPVGVVLREVEDLRMTMTIALVWRNGSRSTAILRFSEAVESERRILDVATSRTDRKKLGKSPR
jgi:DNA-binding transcriptional LysR family regulator